jgi:hypothetical protein
MGAQASRGGAHAPEEGASSLTWSRTFGGMNRPVLLEKRALSIPLILGGFHLVVDAMLTRSRRRAGRDPPPAPEEPTAGSLFPERRALTTVCRIGQILTHARAPASASRTTHTSPGGRGLVPGIVLLISGERERYRAPTATALPPRRRCLAGQARDAPAPVHVAPGPASVSAGRSLPNRS